MGDQTPQSAQSSARDTATDRFTRKVSEAAAVALVAAVVAVVGAIVGNIIDSLWWAVLFFFGVALGSVALLWSWLASQLPTWRALLTWRGLLALAGIAFIGVATVGASRDDGGHTASDPSPTPTATMTVPTEVDTGPAQVPDVINLRPVDAASMIETGGLVATEVCAADPAAGEAGLVYATTPDALADVERGTEVKIYVNPPC